MGISQILLLIMVMCVATVHALSVHGSEGVLSPNLLSLLSIALAPSMSSSRHHTSFHEHHARNRFRNSAPLPSYRPPPNYDQRGPSISPYQSPSPTQGSPASAPAPSPATLSIQFRMPTIAPTISTIGRTPPPPVMALPPLPRNKDCVSVTCTEPLTYTPPGSPCGCVWPIQVKLRLNVALYTFFPLVSELASEIAAAVSLNHSQVRIIGADAASQQLEKTTVLINLVPLGLKFNSTTVFSTYEKFWHKQVLIKTSIFGAYDVLYVHYPGLPPSPPSSPSSISTINDPAYPGNNDDGSIIKPLGVDVSGRRKKHRLSASMIAVIVLSSFTAFVILIGIAWLFLLKSGACVFKSEHIPQALISSPKKQSGAGGTMTFGRMPNPESMLFSSNALTYAGAAKMFALNDIERATNNFDASRIVGEGGFGLVYHGILDDGREVAVKVLKRDDQHGGREFLAEVEMLGRLHHRNLVKLIGICTEGHTRCLVYEFVPNGSVESHLHGVDKETAPLDWDARIKIALGAARGLAYLHEDSSPRVIHRDFKSSNILLEHDFTPKVSDFGLARAALDEGNKHISTHIMGTFGYLAPEYAMTGHLLVKSDVYSYGVVLLELLTGRKPVDLSQPPGEENLVSWARQHLTNMEILETIIDSTIKFDASFDSVAKVAAIASMCVQPEVSHRPFMGEVVQALKLVCNEFDEITRASGEPMETLQTSQSIPGCHTDETKRAWSVSELMSTTMGVDGHESKSFRRHSSSGPLGTGRGRQFWHRLRSLSSTGSSSEHGYSSKLWP